jgi:hypothetical protein
MKMDNKLSKIGAVLLVIVIIMTIIYCFIISTPLKITQWSISDGEIHGEIKSDSDYFKVTIEPENPKPGELINISVEVDSTQCYLHYATFFTRLGGGGKNLDWIGVGKFETTFGPFEDGTEIWLILTVPGDEGYILSDNYFIQIGKVERDDKTELTFNYVTQSHEIVTEHDSDLTFTANVTSNVPIDSVELKYMFFGKSDSLLTGTSRMQKNAENVYMYEGFEKWIVEKGDILLYRIAAKDNLGNTAVWPVKKITIS